MKEVNEEPETGQFVAMWTYGGEIWSSTYKYIEGELAVYCEEEDDFLVDEENSQAIHADDINDVRYFVVN